MTPSKWVFDWTYPRFEFPMLENLLQRFSVQNQALRLKFWEKALFWPQKGWGATWPLHRGCTSEWTPASSSPCSKTSRERFLWTIGFRCFFEHQIHGKNFFSKKWLYRYWVVNSILPVNQLSRDETISSSNSTEIFMEWFYVQNFSSFGSSFRELSDKRTDGRTDGRTHWPILECTHFLSTQKDWKEIRGNYPWFSANYLTVPLESMNCSHHLMELQFEMFYRRHQVFANELNWHWADGFYPCFKKKK